MTRVTSGFREMLLREGYTAIHQLTSWVRTGRRPPLTPRYRFDDGRLAKDADQNTLGGIRLAPMEVSVATYLSTSCNLG